MKEKLKERKERKAKKPTFQKQDAGKKPSLPQGWRKPRGRQSKMRLNKRGYRRSPSTGWGSPRAVKGRSPEGLLPVVVATIAELERLDPKQHGVILAATVGEKKREGVLTKAKSRGLTVLNVKDVDAAVKKITEKFAGRKAAKATRSKTKAEKEKEAVKAAEDKKAETIEKKVEGKQTEEEKKAKEAEKQKILTKKQ